MDTTIALRNLRKNRPAPHISPGKPASGGNVLAPEAGPSRSAPHLTGKPDQATESSATEAKPKLYISKGCIVSTVMTKDSVPAPPNLTLGSSTPPLWSNRRVLQLDNPVIPRICQFCFPPTKQCEYFRLDDVKRTKVCKFCPNSFPNYRFGIHFMNVLEACLPCCQKRNKCQSCLFSLDPMTTVEMTKAFAVNNQSHLNDSEYERIAVVQKMRDIPCSEPKKLEKRKSARLAAQAQGGKAPKCRKSARLAAQAQGGKAPKCSRG